MKKIEIKHIYAEPELYLNKEIKVSGWIKSSRDNKNFAFYDLNDGTSLKGIQIFLNKEEIENFEEVKTVATGSSIEVEGILVESPNKNQPYEIQANKVSIINEATNDYPIQKKRHTMEFLRQFAYLRPRTNLFNAVFRVRSECAFAIHNFFHKEGFVYVNSPIITSSDCEGAGELFTLTTHDIYNKEKMKNATPENDFFGKSVYLTPTGQLEAEAFSMGFSKVYTFGPTFRSENSNTTRHASEFWMIEPEASFFNLEDIMELAEKLIKSVISHIKDTCKDELNLFNSFVDNTLIERLDNLLNNKFGVITYTDAIKILEENNDKFDFKVSWGADIQSEHEKFLSGEVFKKPVFVTDYPKEIKAFYMKQNEDGKTVRACDLLVPGIGELIGGSQREENYEKLLQRVKDCGLKEKDYEWYLNLRRFGSVEHSGFGVGFERLLMYVTGMTNIRDVLPFPRTPKNCL